MKGFKILFGIAIILFIGDFVSTVLNWGLIKHLESNPLYKVGGLPLICFINIGLLYLCWRWYKKTDNPGTSFVILFLLVMLSTTRVLVIYNNLQWFFAYKAEPIVIAAKAAATTTADKIQTIKWIYRLNLLPALNAILTWIFFEKDHYMTRK
jgi:hypothetical protein